VPRRRSVGGDTGTACRRWAHSNGDLALFSLNRRGAFGLLEARFSLGSCIGGGCSCRFGPSVHMEGRNNGDWEAGVWRTPVLVVITDGTEIWRSIVLIWLVLCAVLSLLIAVV
jgi:hypothetical protein